MRKLTMLPPQRLPLNRGYLSKEVEHVAILGRRQRHVHARSCSRILKEVGCGNEEANRRASLTTDEHPSAIEEEVAFVPHLFASGNVVMSCLVFIFPL